MGRAPCCDKASVRKGAWSAEEDALLRSYIHTNGTATNWIALPKKIGLNRCGKSCRLRWLNYLRPNIKHGGFSEEEDNIIANLYFAFGSRWSIIAEKLRGRTDNDIKNYWNTKLQKKFMDKKKNSCRRLSSYGGFFGTHEHSNPNPTAFTITNSHLMSSNWTRRPAPKLYPPPRSSTGRASFEMISFSSMCQHCNKQQEHEHGPIINDFGSSSSRQQHSRNGCNNDDNVRLGTILRDMEAALLANDAPAPYQETDGLVPLPRNRYEEEMVGNSTVGVASNEESYEESVGSLDWDVMNSLKSFPMDEFDDYINWEEISLIEASIDA